MIIIPEYMFMPDASIAGGKEVHVGGDGTIMDIRNTEFGDQGQEKRIHLNGLLMPGLVNSHCHLELSWCRGLYPENAGMEAFYGAMSGVHSRRPSDKIILTDIQHAIDEQSKQGVVAIADISNTDITLSAKISSRLYFHTFLEIFGTNPREALYRINDLMALQRVFAEENQSASLSAHTLITLSENLMSLLMTRIAKEKTFHSIHFLESNEEKLFFEKKLPVRNVHGPVTTESLYGSAAEAACRTLPTSNKIMFVHNTFAEQKDIEHIVSCFKNPWFCFCPGSNKFITGKLPDVPMISSLSRNILIGTDSLSSNHELNMFAEIDILLDEYSELQPETLLQAATLNGALFLGIDNRFGSIAVNKKPGLVLLENYQPGTRNFGSLSVKRLY